MQWQYHEQSEQGGRTLNQDAYQHVIAPDWACFVMADGLGGQTRGELAATQFCAAICSMVPNYAEKITLEPLQALSRLIKSAAQQMRRAIIAEHGQIDTHTTMALVWLDQKNLVTAHIGDSRVYRFNQKEILWRSSDHTATQSLFEQGLVPEDDMGQHFLQNQLLKTINMMFEPEPDIRLHSPLQDKETLLLCTDGFWSAYKKQALLAVGQQADLSEVLSNMVKHIIESDPRSDNVTVQGIRTFTPPL